MGQIIETGKNNIYGEARRDSFVLAESSAIGDNIELDWDEWDELMELLEKLKKYKPS